MHTCSPQGLHTHTHTKMSTTISPLQIKIERKERHHSNHEVHRSSRLIKFSFFQHTTSLVFTNQVSVAHSTQQTRAVHTKGKLFQYMHHTHTQNTNKKKLSQPSLSPTLQLVHSANTHSHQPSLLQFKNKNLFANNTLNLDNLNLIINSADNNKINNSAYSPNSSNYHNNDLPTFNE